MATPRSTELVSPAAPARNGHSVPAVAHGQLAMLATPQSATAEAYRTLAVNLQFSDIGVPARTIAVTSAAAGDGKSTTVANLGVAMAESGRSVILVDADLRRPGLHTLFGLENSLGLSSAVVADSEALPLQETGVPHIRLLSSGPRTNNPTAILGSERMRTILAQLREEADVVILDTAPAVVLADTAILAPKVDGIVLVVGAGRTKRDLARQAKEHLERVNANILGVVLNGVRADS